MNTALLVIDVQKGIDEAAHWGGSRNNPEAEGNIKLLLDEWRRSNLPLVIIKHDSKNPGSPFFPSSPGNLLKDFILPYADSSLITKSTTNAFLETGLESLLRKMGVNSLLITGFVTNNSVEATTRMAGEIGFATTVVSDATACFAKKGLDGTVFSSELIHQVSLSNMAGEYADIKTTAQYLSALKQKTK